MARRYSIVKQDTVAGNYYTEYVVDVVADIADLPVQPECATGSKATVIATGKVYMLNHDKQWIEQAESGGGGLTPEDEERIIQEAVARSLNLIVDGASTDYDTLKEIADYIAQDKIDTAYAKEKVDSFGPYTDEEIDDIFN